MARISPVRGSMATMAPFFPSSACSAAICRSISIVSLSCLPGTAGVSSSAPDFLPAAVHQDLARAVLAHQHLVVLLLDARKCPPRRPEL